MLLLPEVGCAITVSHPLLRSSSFFPFKRSEIEGIRGGSRLEISDKAVASWIVDGGAAATGVTGENSFLELNHLLTPPLSPLCFRFWALFECVRIPGVVGRLLYLAEPCESAVVMGTAECWNLASRLESEVCCDIGSPGIWRAVVALHVEGGAPVELSVLVEGVEATSGGNGDDDSGIGVAFLDRLRSSCRLTMPGKGNSLELPYRRRSAVEAVGMGET